MDISSSLAHTNIFPTLTTTSVKSHFNQSHSHLIVNPIPVNKGCKIISKTQQYKRTSRICSVSDVPTIVFDPAQVEVTWEIVVGALAGIIPFVVAGIEFRKRIVKQKKCETCGGSGLVLRDKKYYFRCPSCGGFLPWYSWRRFFTG